MPVSRREFLSTAALSAGVLTAGPFSNFELRTSNFQGPVVDAAILRRRLESLSVFGRPTNGSFADGVSRVAYSDADVAGRRYVVDLIRTAGLEPRIDPAGNIFAKRAGTEPSLPPILFGSHIDSVPSGGNFDGDLGSLAALGAIEALDRGSVRTRHPLQMAIWTNEEGGFTGSGAAAGELHSDDLNRVYNGIQMSNGVRKLGGD